jgi:hypothetical protein
VNPPQLMRIADAPTARQAQSAGAKRKAQSASAKRQGASASGKLCAGRRLIGARLRARRPRGELVGYLAGKLTGVPAG